MQPQPTLKELIVTVRKFESYSVQYNKELSGLLKKPYWLTNESYCYFVGDKYSNRWSLVPRGFASDGASVPAFLQGLVPVWGLHGAAVLNHDRMCELGYIWELKPNGLVEKVYLTRREIDNIFFESLKVVDAPLDLRRKIEVGVNAYRIFTKPTVPNPNTDKERFEMNYRASRGWAELDGSRLYEYLGIPTSEVAL